MNKLYVSGNYIIEDRQDELGCSFPHSRALSYYEETLTEFRLNNPQTGRTVSIKFEDVSDWSDVNGTPFDKDSLQNFLRANTNFINRSSSGSTSGGGQTSGGTTATSDIFQSVDQFSMLAPGTEVGQLSIVRNSSGIPYVNFKDSGLYIWNGIDWQSGDKDLLSQINFLKSEIDSLKQSNEKPFSQIEISKNVLIHNPLNSSEEYSVALEMTTTENLSGTYKLTLSYNWNSNSTREDFESVLLVDGVSIGSNPTGLVHKEEAKDSAGDFSSTGSSQSISFVKTFIFVKLNSNQPSLITLKFKGSRNNIVSMWDSFIEIEKI